MHQYFRGAVLDLTGDEPVMRLAGVPISSGGELAFGSGKAAKLVMPMGETPPEISEGAGGGLKTFSLLVAGRDKMRRVLLMGDQLEIPTDAREVGIALRVNAPGDVKVECCGRTRSTDDLGGTRAVFFTGSGKQDLTNGTSLALRGRDGLIGEEFKITYPAKNEGGGDGDDGEPQVEFWTLERNEAPDQVGRMVRS